MSVSPEVAAAIIDDLGLEPLPVEGILFRQTWRRIRHGEVLGTAIFAAITSDPDSFSAMHRLTEDEVWHFYLGDPVRLLLLHPNGTIEEPVLGSDLLGGQFPHRVVPAGTWMGGALEPGGTFALFGSTMAPGFTSSMFETGVREELSAGWPEASARIAELTREGAPLEMPEGY